MHVGLTPYRFGLGTKEKGNITSRYRYGAHTERENREKESGSAGRKKSTAEDR